MCVTVLSVNATPINWMKDKLGIYEMSDDNSKFKNRVIELFSCAMCSGFWVGFIGCFFLIDSSIVMTILYASIISIGSEIINKNIRKD